MAGHPNAAGRKAVVDIATGKPLMPAQGREEVPKGKKGKVRPPATTLFFPCCRICRRPASRRRPRAGSRRTTTGRCGEQGQRGESRRGPWHAFARINSRTKKTCRESSAGPTLTGSRRRDGRHITTPLGRPNQLYRRCEMVGENILRVPLCGLVAAGMLALASAAQAQFRSGASLRRGNHVTTSKFARLGGGGSYRFVRSNQGRLSSGGSQVTSTGSSGRSARRRRIEPCCRHLEKPAQSFHRRRSGRHVRKRRVGNQQRSFRRGRCVGGNPPSLAEGAERQYRQCCDFRRGNLRHRNHGRYDLRHQDLRAGASGPKHVAPRIPARPPPARRQARPRPARRPCRCVRHHIRHGHNRVGVQSGHGKQWRAGADVYRQVSYTPKDQSNHSLVVHASSRDEAKEKVLARYPHAVFRSILAI